MCFWELDSESSVLGVPDDQETRPGRSGAFHRPEAPVDRSSGTAIPRRAGLDCGAPYRRCPEVHRLERRAPAESSLGQRRAGRLAPISASRSSLASACIRPAGSTAVRCAARSEGGQGPAVDRHVGRGGARLPACRQLGRGHSRLSEEFLLQAGHLPPFPTWGPRPFRSPFWTASPMASSPVSPDPRARSMVTPLPISARILSARAALRGDDYE